MTFDSAPALAPRTLFAVLLLFIGASPACAQHARPFKGLDAWTYRQDVDEGGWPSGPYRPQVVVGYLNVAGGWALGIRSADDPAGAQRDLQLIGTIHDDDCIVDVLNADTLQQRPCTAPEPGAAWTIDGRTPSTLNFSGRERITVPAGSFDTWRIESSRPNPTDEGGATLTATYWYSPEVHAMVRAEHHFQTRDGAAGTTREVLTSFTRNGVRTPPATANRGRAVSYRMTPDCTPVFPPAALAAQVTGQTRVQVVVGPDGHVLRSRVVGASGTTREHRMLDIAASTSLTGCHFEPALSESGEPVQSSVVLGYTWSLR